MRFFERVSLNCQAALRLTFAVFWLPVTFGFTPFSPVASAAQTATIAYPAVGPGHSGILIAKELRTFEKYGVQVDVVYIPSGPLAVSALIAGNLTLAIAASNAVISAISKGAPLIAVAAQTNRPAMTLFVQPDISRPAQLEGKVIGITRPGGVVHFLAGVLLQKFGLQGKVGFQSFGGNQEQRVAFAGNRVAAILTTVSPSPHARPLVNLADLGIPFANNLMVVRRELHDGYPQIVEAILKGYIEGVVALRTRKREALKVMEKYLGSRELQDGYEY